MRTRLLADESGVVAPLAILLLLALLGFTALVLDVGMIYAFRRSLQNAADAAALAGAGDLQRELLGALADPVGQAETFAARNGVPAAYGDCTRDDTSTLAANRPGALAHSWEVEASRLVPLTFGRAVGIATQCVRARSVGVVVELRPTKIWPFGVLQSSVPAPGTSVVLKQAAGEATEGNFGLVDFTCGGGGTDDYRTWVLDGYGSQPGETVPTRVPPGTWTICTETGNRASENEDLAAFVAEQQTQPCAYAEPDVRCPLVGLVPIIGEASWPSGTKAIPVIRFAAFALEGVTVEHGTGHMELVGRFLDVAGGVGPTFVPDPTGQLHGLIGVRLWE